MNLKQHYLSMGLQKKDTDHVYLYDGGLHSFLFFRILPYAGKQNGLIHYRKRTKQPNRHYQKPYKHIGKYQ